MKNRLIQAIDDKQIKKEIPDFHVGDAVDVHVKIIEGDKERVQVYSGTVIARKNGGIGETFTVRRIVQAEGVERTFPIHSPKLDKIVVKRRGNVRRAKLFYLRDRVGKATRIRESDEKIPVEASTPVAAPEKAEAKDAATA
ncbi:MAG: 50S ribosomal protein L19 [Planctomycetota bacterium]